jgi:SpoVK/Ycf46/Vps4 family AAA+-type ATPase
MLEVIDELLMQIGKYPGFQMLATNKPELLDPALDRRILATIHVDVPAERERYRLWKQKLPADYPLKLEADQLLQLATNYIITGNDIENVIIEVSADALRQDSIPTFEMLLSATAMMHNHKIEIEAINNKVATLQQSLYEHVK